MADLVWHLNATTDLEWIAEYIGRDSERIAISFCDRIVQAAERLHAQPQLGRPVPEMGDPSYREVLFQNYRIVYRLIREAVVIIAIVHAAMDMDRVVEQRKWEIL